MNLSPNERLMKGATGGSFGGGMLLLLVSVTMGSLLPRLAPNLNPGVEVVAISMTIALTGVLYCQGPVGRITHWSTAYLVLASMAAVAGVGLWHRMNHGPAICQWLVGAAGLGVFLGALRGPEAAERRSAPEPPPVLPFRLMGMDPIFVSLTWFIERLISSRPWQAILTGLLGGILGGLWPSVLLWALIDFFQSRGEGPGVNLAMILVGGMSLGGVAGSWGSWTVWCSWQRARSDAERLHCEEEKVSGSDSADA